MSEGRTVAVVGAGFGGLVISIVLARMGFDVHLFEAKEGVESGRRPLILHDNGQRVLRALGLTELLATGRPLESVSIDILGEAPIATLFFDDDAAWSPSLSLSAGGLLTGLKAAAAKDGVKMHLGRPVQSAWVEEERAYLSLGEGDNHDAWALVIADGARSSLRSPMGFQGRVEPTGVSWVWGVSEHRRRGGGLREILGPNHTRFISFPLDKERTGFYCTVPAGSWDRIRDDRLEEWIEGWQPFGDDAVACLRGVEGWSQVESQASVSVDLTQWYKPPAFMIGDGAHAMPVGLGWGASAAMVDGLVLGQLLARGAKVGVGLGDIGHTWENIRRPFVTQAQALSRQLLSLADLSSAPAKRLREAFMPLAKRAGFLGERMEKVLIGHYPLEEPYFCEIPKRPS